MKADFQKIGKYSRGNQSKYHGRETATLQGMAYGENPWAWATLGVVLMPYVSLR
jgi:hypothetical protein